MLTMAMRGVLAAASAALVAAAWYLRRRRNDAAPSQKNDAAPSAEPEQAPPPPKRIETRQPTPCACGCGQIATSRCSRCKTARYATRACQATHAKMHAATCYHDAGVRALIAGEPRQAATLFETSVDRADALPPEDRGIRQSAAYLALGRARSMCKDFPAARAAYASGVCSARAAHVAADEIECRIGAANVVRATTGASAAIELFAAAAARADDAMEDDPQPRLVAARASAWANEATATLATPGSDTKRALALLKRALDAREAIAGAHPESREALRQLATCRANYGLALRLAGDPGAEATLDAASAEAHAIGASGVQAALARNAANVGTGAAPPSGSCPICLEAFDGATRTVEGACGHRFCEPCLRTWLGRSNRCPTCRQCLNFAAAPAIMSPPPVVAN